MRCDDVRSWLLSADLPALKAALHGAALHAAAPDDGASQDGPMRGRHLHDCESCREAVECVVQETASMAVWMTDRASAPAPVERILERAGLPAPPDGEPSGPRALPHRTGSLVGLATAAAIAALVLFGQDGDPLPGVPLSASLTSPPVQGIDVTSEQNIAVLPTGDPRITVLWFYE